MIYCVFDPCTCIVVQKTRTVADVRGQRHQQLPLTPHVAALRVAWPPFLGASVEYPEVPSGSDPRQSVFREQALSAIFRQWVREF